MFYRRTIRILLTVAGIISGTIAFFHSSHMKKFQNPVAFAYSGDVFYVVEKESNTVLAFEGKGISKDSPLLASLVRSIEHEGREYYYMARKLYAIPGKPGFVVKSFIYRQDTREFAGYRFRYYPDLMEANCSEILTIFLPPDDSFTEINYACDAVGNHFFLNNLSGHKNIWKMDSGKTAIIKDGNLPKCLKEIGEDNTASSNWRSICVAKDGTIYASDAESGLINAYASDGSKSTVIGKVGFGPGELIAPDEIFYFPYEDRSNPLLTIANDGVRNWVQMDAAGNPVNIISPLLEGYAYKDILTGILFDNPAGRNALSFDLANKALLIYNPSPGLAGSPGHLSAGGKFISLVSYREKKHPTFCLIFSIALIFLLAAIFLDAGIDFQKKIKFPFYLKLIALFIPVIIVSGIVISDMVLKTIKKDLEAESSRRSANLANAVIASIDAEDLEKISTPEDRNSDTYEKIYESVTRIISPGKVDETPKWIIHKIREGRFYFGINIWKGAIYEPFIVTDSKEVFFRAVLDKEAISCRYTDDQGEWVSYLSPIFSRDGKVNHLLELYRPAESIDRSQALAGRKVKDIVVITVVAAVLMTLGFSYFFTRPLRRLKKHIDALGDGHFNNKIDVFSRDEFGDLARTFNVMTDRLKNYMKQLEKTTMINAKIQSDLLVARKLQQEILPRSFPPFPSLPNIEIFALMEPAKEIGGDYYDFFMIDTDHIAVVIADVSGKGIPAALYMMMVRIPIRSFSVGCTNPARTLTKVNTILATDSPSDNFVSIFYMICDIRSGEVTYSNAGHLPPLLSRSGNNIFLGEDDIKYPVAGVIPDFEYENSCIRLDKNDILLLYTDGVTEATDSRWNLFGEEKLASCFNLMTIFSLADICRGIMNEVDDFQRNLQQADDVTLLAFRFRSRNLE